MAESGKRKLLFDYYRGDFSLASDDGSFARKIEKFRENKVKTVFVITSGEVVLDNYLDLISYYEEAGFTVNSINIESLDKEHLLFVKNAVEDINTGFSSGSCLLVSFGDSLAGALLACFYVYSGRSPEDAVGRVRKINKDLLPTEEEKSFVMAFNEYITTGTEEEMREYAEPEPAGTGTAPELTGDELSYIEQEPAEEPMEEAAEELTEKSTAHQGLYKEERAAESIEELPEEETEYITIPPELYEQEKEDAEAEQKAAEEASKKLPSEPGYGSFYSSIRFKLVSITSLLVVISLGGMIALATYFFKQDNTVRVQENNLYVSEVIALKVKSDFQAVIDKSRLLASVLTRSTGKNGPDSYSDLVLSNDRDFIYFSIAAPLNGTKKYNTIREMYNKPLMEENQITVETVRKAGRTNGDAFTDSFDGETVVIHNLSQVFQMPVMGLSLPFRKDARGMSRSILICYLKMDRFLPAFQTSGITKTFMVNNKGDILAHPDSAVIIGGGNYLDLPIVKSMIKSSFPNGQQRYRDENSVYYLGSFHKIGIGGCGVIATVEENVAYQAVYNQQRRNIYLTIIVLTITILIIFFFGKTLTTPIIRLLGATKKIKNGDYNVKIRPAARDEIGELTSAFIEMGQGLEEREKIKTAFGKFVNPELAEMVAKNEVKLGGERKKVAIMFSDIRNFTSMSEKLQPEEVVEFLNEYLTKMVDCIDKTDGIVDKFLGDAIMAEWGVPVSRGNDTEHAVNSTLMMRKALIEFNKERSGTGKPLIKIGCGINTGNVLAGQIGSEDRMEYTVIGDAANLASRIESLNKPFGTDILISQDSYELVKDIFSVEKMSPIKVKGKEETQQIYAVLGRLDDPLRPGNIHELRDLLGTVEQAFHRRAEDSDDASVQSKQDITEEEIKYEILS